MQVFAKKLSKYRKKLVFWTPRTAKHGKSAEKRNNISASVIALTTSVAYVRRTKEKSNACMITFLTASFLGVISERRRLLWLYRIVFRAVWGGFQGFCRLFAHILHKKRRKSCTVNLKCLPLHSLKKKYNGAIAQMVEQRTENPCVPGSIPGGTTYKESFFGVTLFLCLCVP